MHGKIDHLFFFVFLHFYSTLFIFSWWVWKYSVETQPPQVSMQYKVTSNSDLLLAESTIDLLLQEEEQS